VQLVTAIVRPAKVTAVCDALQSFGFQGMTVTETSGIGKQRGHTEMYRGAEYAPAFQPKTRIEVVVRDEDVVDVVEVICTVASTGRVGDGKVWVTPIRDLVRIRTREHDDEAL